MVRQAFIKYNTFLEMGALVFFVGGLFCSVAGFLDRISEIGHCCTLVYCVIHRGLNGRTFPNDTQEIFKLCN